MSSSPTLDEIIALSRNRWTLPLLADLAAHRGARFVELVNRLGIPRDSLVRTLDAVRLQGWIMPNPGHGHPLRPEYLLTEAGARLALSAGELQAHQQRLGIRPGALSRWGMPLVSAIGGGHNRFSAFSRLLAPASPRALSQGLQRLAGHDLIRRNIVESYPPTSCYALTPSGQSLASAL